MKYPVAGLLACALTGAALCGGSATRAQFSSPVPVGVTAATTVDDNDIFDPSPPCDVRVTVVQVRRAAEAWDLIHKASAANKPAAAGFDYVLALVKFEYRAREGTLPGKLYELKADEFSAASAEGRWYDIPSVALPGPTLKPKFASGEFSEGWTVFLVPQEDKKPRLFFRRGNLWFQLY